MLCATALVSALNGCSLIKINGKPLSLSGGSSSSTSPTSSTSPSPDEYGHRTGADPERPFPWCESVTGDDRGTLAEVDKRVKSYGYSSIEQSAQVFAAALCATEGELASQRNRVVAMRDAWMTQYGLDEQDVRFLVGEPREPQNLESFDGPVGEYARLDGTTTDRLLALDKLGPNPSALAKVAAIEACLGTQTFPYESLKRVRLLDAVICTRETLDLLATLREIEAADDLNLWHRYQLRQSAVRASNAVKAATKELAAYAAQEPGVARLIELADQEFKTWAAPSAERTKLVAQLVAMEAATAANKRSAFVGCESRTVATWVSQLSKRKLPPAPEKYQLTTYLNSALSTAEGYLAYAALRLCSAGTEQGTGPRFEVVGSGLIRRGSRTATIASWLSAEKGIEFDDRELSLPRLLGNSGLAISDGYTIGDVHRGVIGSIADVEGGVQVNFKTVREPRITCSRWQATSRIESISAGGAVNYEQRCLASGKVMMDITAEPVKFGKTMSLGLRPGMYLVALHGLPVVATKSPSAEEPVFVLGGLLK
jgi:hypothetical protein